MEYYSFDISPEDQSEFDDIAHEIESIDDDIYKTNRAIGELEKECADIIKSLTGEIDRGKQLAYNNISELAHKSVESFSKIINDYGERLNVLFSGFTSYADKIIKIGEKLEEI